MEDSPAPIRKKMPTAEYSPTAGCAIFVIGSIAVLTFVFWFFYVGWKQKQILEAITEAAPASFTASSLTEADLSSLRQKLSDYATAIAEKRRAGLSLNKVELNHLLVSEKLLAPIQKLIYIEKLGPAVMTNVSLPVKGGYLNAHMEFTILVRPESGIYLRVDKILVPGKSVPEDFVKSYRDLDFLDILLLDPLRNDARVSPVLKETTSVAVQDEALVLSYEASK